MLHHALVEHALSRSSGQCVLAQVWVMQSFLYGDKHLIRVLLLSCYSPVYLWSTVPSSLLHKDVFSQRLFVISLQPQS